MQDSPDLQVFDEVYNRYANDIFRHCYLRIYDRELALDLMQETFIRLWRYQEQGRKVENVRAMLYRIAHNLIVDEVRRLKRRPTSSLDDLQEQGMQFGHDPAEERDAEWNKKKLFATLRFLPSPYQEILVMRYLDGLSPREIARITGRSSAVVSVQLHRGVAKLRSILKNSPFFPHP